MMMTTITMMKIDFFLSQCRMNITVKLSGYILYRGVCYIYV